MGLPLLIEKGGVESGMRPFEFAEDSLLVLLEVLVVQVGSLGLFFHSLQFNHIYLRVLARS